MGKNFVLRGLSGRPAGFVMQAPGVLRFKAQGFAGRRVCLVALYADGTQAEFAGEMEEGENERADRGGCLSGAYLEAEGALLLYTDERARAAYEKNRTRERMRSFEKEERERRESRADGTADPSDSSKSNRREADGRESREINRKRSAEPIGGQAAPWPGKRKPKRRGRRKAGWKKRPAQERAERMPVGASSPLICRKCTAFRNGAGHRRPACQGRAMFPDAGRVEKIRPCAAACAAWPRYDAFRYRGYSGSGAREDQGPQGRSQAREEPAGPREDPVQAGAAGPDPALAARQWIALCCTGRRG